MLKPFVCNCCRVFRLYSGWRKRCCGQALLTLLWLWACTMPAIATITNHDFKFERLRISDFTLDESHIGAIHKVVQDRHGFIWIGGEDGIARYDGDNVKIYKHSEDDPDSISDNRILDIEFDHHDNMWVATGRGLNRYNEDEDSWDIFLKETGNDNSLLVNYVTQIEITANNILLLGTGVGLQYFDPRQHLFTVLPLPTLTSKEVLAMEIDQSGAAWIGTSSGLTAVNLRSEQVVHYQHDPSDSNSLSHNDIYSLFEDSEQRLWIGTLGGGLNRLDTERKIFTHFSELGNDLEKNVASAFAGYGNGNVVITFNGMGALFYDFALDRFSSIVNDPSDPDSVSSNQLEAAFVDKQQNLWLGAFTGELNILNRSNNVFRNFTAKASTENRLIHNSVLAVEQTDDGYVWIGTEGGLSRLDPKTNRFKSYTYSENNYHGLRANPVLALQKDAKDNLWIGTWSGGLHYFDRSQNIFYSFLSESQAHYQDLTIELPYRHMRNITLDDKYIWDIHLDNNNTLWLGTQREGLRFYDETKGQFVQYLPDNDNESSLSWNFVRKIVNDKDNNLWIGTVSGLNFFDRDKQQFTRFYNVPENPVSLSAASAINLLMHSNNSLWVGTEGGGINVLRSGDHRFTRIGENNGLPSMTISSMVEDRNGFVWAGTLNGLAKIHPTDFNDITVFKTHDGIVTNFFNRDASVLTQSGEIYLGGIGGLSAFNPQTLKKYQPDVDIVITDFKINHATIPAGTAPLTSAPYLTTKMSLRHDQNAFTFNFSILDFSDSSLNEYAYRLKGYDKDWNFVGNVDLANYTNLDPGDYVFEVMGISTNKKWQTPSKSINIHIARPPWQSWWAYLGYGVIALSLLYFIYLTQVHRIELRKQTELNKTLMELDDIKDTFLANTTHELRTPLNGIIGIAEYLTGAVASGRNPRDLLQKLEVISLSGKRLSNLVNDILDCSKLQANKLDLIKTDINLHALVDNVFHIVKYLVAGKNVTLINSVPENLPRLYADENRIQQVLLNLVGNAIKFTDSGSITILAIENEHDFEISVADTGIGVEKENIENMFIPYAQVASAGIRRRGGTGLGVPLTKALIELHNGKLSVDSELGVGTKFTFTLPKYVTRGNNFVRVEESDLDIHGRGKKVLIADDDMVSRMVLVQFLRKLEFKVDEASSAKELIHLAINNQYDLIIMDIHMPGQNGLDACRYLRKDVKFENPVLFLSGNSSQEDIDNCIAAGGQMLIPKPITLDKLTNTLARFHK
ncbi:Sensory/regulatory protein RpfC [Thalassocella blandensis]|nr:Sensory/regulatory protein RpfC [Thalassocella blandensis]